MALAPDRCCSMREALRLALEDGEATMNRNSEIDLELIHPDHASPSLNYGLTAASLPKSDVPTMLQSLVSGAAAGGGCDGTDAEQEPDPILSVIDQVVQQLVRDGRLVVDKSRGEGGRPLYITERSEAVRVVQEQCGVPLWKVAYTERVKTVLSSLGGTFGGVEYHDKLVLADNCIVRRVFKHLRIVAEPDQQRPDPVRAPPPPPTPPPFTPAHTPLPSPSAPAPPLQRSLAASVLAFQVCGRMMTCRDMQSASWVAPSRITDAHPHHLNSTTAPRPRPRHLPPQRTSPPSISSSPMVQWPPNTPSQMTVLKRRNSKKVMKMKSASWLIPFHCIRSIAFSLLSMLYK